MLSFALILGNLSRNLLHVLSMDFTLSKDFHTRTEVSVFDFFFQWLLSQIRLADGKDPRSAGWERSSCHGKKLTRWGAPSVFAGGKLRTPSPPTLHRKGVYFYTVKKSTCYHPNLVSLCSDHFCACRKKYPIKIYD